MAEHCIITYCCRDKDPAPGLLLAIKRYRSDRIQSLYRQAIEEGSGFLIFSGQFGLLRPDEEIPWYDHMLQPEEIPAMILKICGPLGRYDAATFYYREGDNIASYLEAIRTAADRTAVTLTERGHSPTLQHSE
ncbi:MAG: hypothetical protein AAB229_09685 [Candidatus Hydrogenedentota bacterium]